MGRALIAGAMASILPDLIRRGWGNPASIGIGRQLIAVTRKGSRAVQELPASVHDHVRTGALGAHAAMKHLVPLARANATDCVRLSDAVAKLRPTSRQLAELCATYASGKSET